MRIGIVGWRGMVGSVLMQRLIAENDLKGVAASFYSSSQAGQPAPELAGKGQLLKSAFDLEQLASEDLILTAQGGDYTKAVYFKLREAGWQGYWIDAASTLRLDPASVIILDPVNREAIDQALRSGIRSFVGGNCTVSLFLMALAPLFKRGLVEWVSTMTYQAVSGAGAQQMRELVEQSRFLTSFGADFSDPLRLADELRSRMFSPELPTDSIGYPLAFNLLPFIDTQNEDGQSREEWKGEVELNRILNSSSVIPVDGVCVRVPVLRSHSQAFTIKLTQAVELDEIEQLIAAAHEWIEVVPNVRSDSLEHLCPAYVSNSLKIVVGRLRKLKLGDHFLGGFTVGDQLLWGAAEPLRRMLRIILGTLD